ncbi:MAG TPA: hypothetical protein VE871_09295 [Longimicrobium sp.]|nr:hypothetical protein [Longimicrobium sp.]
MKAAGKGWRVIALAAFVAACKGDGGTETPVATGISATSPTTQSAIAGTAVASAPAVRVVDQDGDPMPGVAVTFVAAGGGGVATPSVTTDAAGNASAGTWTLGPVAGTQTVTATAGSLPAVQFSATSQARVATTVTATTATTQTGQAGTAVAAAPTVRVNDQTGQPLAGVTVTFAVTAGGGTVGSSTAVTGATGVASANSWTLGATGANTVTASVAGLTTVVFNATAQAPAAASIVAVSSTTQTGTAGVAVAQAPTVRVNSAGGQPLAGVTVTFAVTAGGGTLGQTSVVTGAAGTASAGSWTLGAAGTNTVSATVAGLAPVTFSATATAAANPCSTAAVYTLFSSVSGSLSATDCRLQSGEYIDFYGTSLPTAQAVSFSLSSTAFDAFLEMADANGNLVAISDDVAQGNTNSLIRVFAPAGTYFVGASSYEPGETGSYQLSSAGVAGNNNCGEFWVVPGVVINGQVQSTDCVFDNHYTDEYLVVLNAGQTLTVTMRSTTLDAFLVLYNAQGAAVAQNDDGAGGNDAVITYTATALSAFFLDASTALPATTGSYTLTVTRT